MMKFLLDTNVLSEPLKEQSNRSVMENLQLHSNDIASATLVLHELYFGCYRLPSSQKRKTIEIYIKEVVIETMPILPYCDAAAQWHAKERARLTANGRTPSFIDGQIAAIAYVNNLIVVTRNTADFQSFSDLQVENWYK